jgi:hypothetical protein
MAPEASAYDGHVIELPLTDWLQTEQQGSSDIGG